MNMTDYRPVRLDGLRKAASDMGADAFLVTNIHNVSYLTGFIGSSGFVLAAPGRAVFITDFRYKSQCALEVQGFEIVIQKGRWTDEVVSLVRDMGVRRLGFEGRDVPYDTHAALAAALPGVELAPSRDAVEQLRIIKDDGEIGRIKEAIVRAERGYEENRAMLAPGVSEAEAALGLEFNIRKSGSLKVPFDIIVASGKRAALPHGIASEKTIKRGETLVVDFGGEAYGYQSDITRSGVVGKASRRQAEIYRIVAEAQMSAIEAVRPGVRCKDVDLAARGYIASKGYGDNFGHGLGHGVGLEVHEAPNISPMSEDEVRPGMVFTIEPGIYIPGWGGFRIEDMVLVTEDGSEVLTALPRDIKL